MEACASMTLVSCATKGHLCWISPKVEARPSVDQANGKTDRTVTEGGVHLLGMKNVHLGSNPLSPRRGLGDGHVHKLCIGTAPSQEHSCQPVQGDHL